MSDFLLELGESRFARDLIKRSGLPIPIPVKLARARGPWTERELDDHDVVFGAAPNGRLAGAVAATLTRNGANPHLTAAAPAEAFAGPGAAWGRPAVRHEAPPEGVRFHGLVFDASGLADPAGLRALYDFFHPWLGALATGGRIVVLGAPPETVVDPAASAAQRALEGFVRSVAKEVGKRGATAQLLLVAEGAEDRAPAALRFLLSARSAFITGQPLRVTCTATLAGEAGAEARWLRPLHGKVALVTGAARGIGEATARRLAEEGARVIVLDRPRDDGPASRVARDIGGELLLCDVSAADAPEAIARALAEEHGGVDVVVHNAGVTRDKTLKNMREQAWDQAVDINLGGVVAITDALSRDGGPLRDGGRVILLSSIAGIAGNFGQTNYAAAKAGVIGYARALAPRLGARGITVNAIAPGFIETRLTAAIPPMTREVVRRMSALAQGGEPLDVAELATFLASPGAAGVSGEVIRICGGNLVGA